MSELRLISVFARPRGDWAARSVDMPGFDGEGRTPVEALRSLLDEYHARTMLPPPIRRDHATTDEKQA